MFKKWVSLVRNVLLVVMVASAQSVAANTSEPEVMIADLTKDVLAQIKRHREKEINFEQFIEVIEVRLNKSIDFDFIVRGVMGGARRDATDDQRARFLRVFKDGMIDTYAMSFMDYNQESVQQQPMDPSMEGRNRVQIKQVLDDGSVVLNVAYTVAKTPKGWMIVNVNVNGINLGARYRSQFTKAYKKNASIDTVIEGWKTDNLRF